MAAKKDFRQDSADILGIRRAVPAPASGAASAEQEPVPSGPKAGEAKEQAPTPPRTKPRAAKEKAPPPTNLVGDGSGHSPPLETPERGTYYLPKAYKKAIRLRIATSDRPGDKDISSILKAALDEYLSPELQQIRKGS